MLYQDHPKIQKLLEELFQEVTCWYNSTGECKEKNAEQIVAVWRDIMQCQVDIEAKGELE